jgi:KDO2-lipid IV(A) lauroyltransferase
MACATGLKHLDNLKGREQGALLYSGHFGNFSLMLIWLAVKGYPIAVVYKEAENFLMNLGNIAKFNITPLKYKSDPTMTVSIIRL